MKLFNKNILITPKFFLDKHKQLNFSIEYNWIKYSNKMNFNLHVVTGINQLSDKFDALILSGGNSLYKHSKLKIDKNRETFEKNIVKKFQKIGKPILGVCRGAQLLGELNGLKTKKISNHVNINHKIYDENKNVLSVNSFHNYGFKNFKKNNLEHLMVSKDGSLEYSKIKKSNIYLMMFHPERKNNSQINIDNILNDILFN